MKVRPQEIEYNRNRNREQVLEHMRCSANCEIRELIGRVTRAGQAMNQRECRSGGSLDRCRWGGTVRDNLPDRCRWELITYDQVYDHNGTINWW